MIDIKKSCALKEHHELLWHPNLRLRRTFGPVRLFLFALFGVVGVVRRRGLPFSRPLGPPQLGGLLLLFSLRWGGELSSSSSSFSREEGVSDSSDDESDTTK